MRNDDYYEILDDRDSGGRYRARPGTEGPWVAGFQHGGPPSALLVRAAERAAAALDTAASVRRTAVRAAVEFVGPVPVAEVTVTTHVVRAARSAVLVEARLDAGDRPCLHARVWMVRHADTAELSAALPPAVEVPTDLPGIGGAFPYHDTIDWRALRGSLRTPGPALVWARPRIPLVAGEAMTGLQRAVLVGDSASGISSELDWDRWSFVNIDLDVHLARPAQSDWVLMDAVTTVGSAGSALTRATLSDVHGPVGATAQTLVLSPR